MSLITPDFGLLVWMTLIFGIVFFILAKFGFPVITSMVSKRAEHIEKALQDAEKAARELEGMDQTCREMMEKARLEQEELLSQARATSAQIVEEAKTRAAKEASQIIVSAREQIAVEKQEAINELRNVVVDLSVAVAGKLMRQDLGAAPEQTELVEKILSELQATKE